MHHNLLLIKALRAHGKSKKPNDVDLAIQQISQKVAVSLVDSILSEDLLNEISIDEIIRFRNETKSIRKEMIEDIEKHIPKTKITDDKAFTKSVSAEFNEKLRAYKNELQSARDKIWYKILPSSPKQMFASGGSLATGITLFSMGLPASLIAASIAPPVLMGIRSYWKSRCEEREIVRSASPTIAYLSKLEKRFGAS